jgi:hypothetical protein
MPQKAYLDSQCLAYLLGQPVFNQGWSKAGTAKLRTAVDGAIRKGELIVLGSQFHLEEASRIPDGNGERKRFLEFFWNTVQWALLSPTYDLVREEWRLRRPLEGNEPFEEFDYRHLVRRVSLTDPERFTQLADKVKAFVDKNVAGIKKRKSSAAQKIAAVVKGKTAARVTQQWWQDADAQIDDWVMTNAERIKDEFGFGDDKGQWPTPRDQQTTWAIYAYSMARIYLNVGLNRAIIDGDTHDTHHYASACYADVFVTEDGPFRETMSVIPRSPVTALSFKDFAAQFRIIPS